MVVYESFLFIEFIGGGFGGRVDGCGCSASFNFFEYRLFAVFAVGSGVGCFRGFFLVVIEGD